MVYIDMKNKVKYDTDKMELVSAKIKFYCKDPFWDLKVLHSGRLYRSKKGNWLGVIEHKSYAISEVISEEKVKEMLMQYDVDKYEEIFGKLEEA